MIVLPLSDERAIASWHAVLDVGLARPHGWTLIGAQMVALHAAERGRYLPRTSTDADLLADVRLVAGIAEALASTLLDLGFRFVDSTPDGVGHRFRKGGASLDILVPEGLGARTAITTVYPAHTVSVPGGTQALRRTEPVPVSAAGRVGTIPRPNLLGAILLKCRAVEVDDIPDSQRLDLAVLLSLVDDPRAMAKELTGRERSWLRRRRDLLDRSASIWLRLGSSADDAYLALRILANA